MSRGENIAPTVYGTVLALGVVAIGSEFATDAEVFWSVLATSVVFFMAHIYAEAVAAWIEDGRRPTLRSLKDAALNEWPMVTAGVPILAALALGGFDVIDEDAGYWLAMGVGIAALALFGLRIARRERAGVLTTLLLMGMTAGFGALMAMLKVAVH